MSGRRVHAMLLWLAAAALVLGQAGGAYLHLCPDGTQAPLSVHALAPPGHHGHQPGAHHAGTARHYAPDQSGTGQSDGHADRDLAMSGAALAKAGKTTLDLPLLAVLCVLALALLAPSRRGVLRAARAPWSDATRWRPPLRGPPPFSLR